MPWLDRPVTTRLAVGFICGVIALFSVTFLVGSTPDEEEFRFAVLTTWNYVSALREGHFEFWTATLGLGVPQPFTPSFLLHPLLPLLAFVSPITWVRVVLLAHTLIGAAGMWQLTRYLGVRAVTSALCAATFLLATPAQNYVLTDFWLSHYIAWTAAPWLLLLAWRLLESDGRALRVLSLACGFCGGLVAANGNPGHLIVYGTVVAAVLLTHRRAAVARARWLMLSAVIAIALASPGLVQLAREWPLFAPDLGLANARDALRWPEVWNAFLSPFGPANDRVPFARTLFFGGPFAVLCALACVRCVRRRADLVLIVVASAVLLFATVVPLGFASARFHFRDPLTLAAITLAGLTFDRLLTARRSRPVAALVFLAQVAVLIASAWPAMADTLTADARAAESFLGGTGVGESVHVLLNLAAPMGRMVFTPTVDEEISGGKRLVEGFGVNALAYRGVPVVNGWFKGVSAGTVWPDERLFYARALTPQPLLDSAASLDVLGIRYVLANTDDAVTADLRRRGDVPKKDGTHFVLYENLDAWPQAFVLDAAAERLPIGRLPGCNNNRVLCADLTPLTMRRSPDDPAIAARNGHIDVRLVPGDEARLLVISQMFRPDWVASSGDAGLSTVQAFGGLLGVRVPPGTDSVQLRYRPIALILATALAWSTLVAGLVAAIRLRIRTPRRSP